MSDQFLGEIRILACNFPPKGWAFCDGQLMPIAQNSALFSILGTYYGGDGRVTFGLPNFQAIAPMFYGNGPGLSPHAIGETGGSPNVTLLSTQLPPHNHGGSFVAAAGSSRSNKVDPNGATVAGNEASFNLFSQPAAASMAPTSPTGGNLPHNNMQPYQVLNYCIAINGIYPQRP